MNEISHLKGLTSSFGKNLVSESSLAALNESLVLSENKIISDCSLPEFPTIFVLGAPRSGTTLISQLLTEIGQFGVINNFVAKFWLTPSVGMLIDRTLGISAGGVSNYASIRGKTDGWHEPSEFGYFWSRFFDKGQDTHLLGKDLLRTVDIDRMRKMVASLERISGKPMVFKNNTWFAFHSSFLSEVFPKAAFVICRKKPADIARSIMVQRFDLYGTYDQWWSMKPPGYERTLKMSPVEQVSYQAVATDMITELAISKVPKDRVIDATYERFVLDVHSTIRSIVKVSGVEADLSEIPKSFSVVHEPLKDPTLGEQIEEAVGRWTRKLEEENPSWLQ